MIDITSGKMKIPEKERFIGFVGDNLYSKITFRFTDVVDTECEYKLCLEFKSGTKKEILLDSKLEEKSTHLDWIISEKDIVETGLINARIKVTYPDSKVYHTTSDCFIAAPIDVTKQDCSEKENYDDIFENKINDIVTQITDIEKNGVPNTRTIAGLSLESDITAQLLTESLKTYPVLKLSSAPTNQTVGKIGQLAFERSTTNGVDFNNRLYFCYHINQYNEHLWVLLTHDNSDEIKSVNEVHINTDGELLMSFSDGTNKNLGKVVGTDGVNGKDGANGADGYSPSISVSSTETGYMLAIDHDENFTENVFIENGKDGTNGVDGKDGKDGYTPIKGVDYYTENEKADIIMQAKAGLSQISPPTVVSSVDGMTDIDKHYVLNGNIYAYMYKNKSGTISQKIETIYTDGYRLSTSDGSLKALTGATTTDFIDISNITGDLTLNLTGIQWADASQNQACAIVGYNADKTLVQKHYLIVPSNLSSGVTISGVTTDVTIEIPYDWVASCSYIRICGSGVGANASIEISYEGQIQGYEWTNTGLQYTATLYTDLIGVVDENNVIHLSTNNLPSGTYTLKYGDENYDTIGTITVD